MQREDVSERPTQVADERPAFIDPQTDWVECWMCGQVISDLSRVTGIDISRADEYYPTMVAVCPSYNTGSERDSDNAGGGQR
jgi:hypothetical protein